MLTPVPAAIDLSRNNAGPHLDTAEFYHALRATGVGLVLHKASQGVAYPRSAVALYANRRKLATDAGLAWEAYHFLTADPAEDQINYFLSLAEPDAKMRLALDCEENPSGGTVSPDGAAAAAAALDASRGRQALRYTGAGYVTPARLPRLQRFLRGPLWLAKYGPAPTAAYLAGLGMDPTDLVLWQYTASATLAGEHPLDASTFTGTAAELAAWPHLARFPDGAVPVVPPAPVARPVLRTGAPNPSAAVTELQQRLTALGYPCGPTDGTFGPKTYLGVVAFQRAHRLPADGVVGPRTWGALSA